MTATKSSNLAGSGFVDGMTKSGRRHILVITNNNHLRRALYERLVPPDRIAGIFCPASFHLNPDPFTTTISTPSNLTAGLAMWPYRNDFQPNAGGGTQREGYAFNVASATWDGTAGIQANFMPIGGWREMFWAQAADVAADAELATFSLSGSFATQVEPAWYERALTAIAVVRVPAANTAGPPTLPINGGPSLKLGLRRGVASYSLGSASSLTTTAQYVAISGTLSAASGVPSASLNNGATTTNRGRRAIPVGVHFRVTDSAVGGTEIVCIGWEGARHDSVSSIVSGDVGIVTADTINGLSTALGITQWDAVIVDLSSAIEAGFISGDTGTDHLSGLSQGDPGIPSGGSGGTWGEYVFSDFENHLRDVTSIGNTTPICWINAHPSGHIHSDGVVSPSLSVAETIAETQDIDALYAVSHPSDTQFGVSKGCFVNWRAHCGLTQQQVLTSSNVVGPGTTYGGVWSAGTKNQGTVWCNTTFGNATLDPAYNNLTSATRWFKVTAASTTKEPGVTANWDDDWDELDLSATADFTDDKVDFLQARIDAFASQNSLSSSTSNAARTSRTARVSRVDRL